MYWSPIKRFIVLTAVFHHKPILKEKTYSSLSQERGGGQENVISPKNNVLEFEREGVQPI